MRGFRTPGGKVGVLGAGFALVLVVSGCCGTADPCRESGPCTGDYEYYNESDFAGAGELTTCSSISGDLVFFELPWLTSVDLRCLESVDGDLTIDGNDSLTRINLPALRSVGENLRLNNNDALTSLHLPVLWAVGGRMNIVGNNRLDSLAGLPNLEAVGQYLSIYNNFCLSPSEARTFSAGIEITPPVDLFGTGRTTEQLHIDRNGANYPCL